MEIGYNGGSLGRDGYLEAQVTVMRKLGRYSYEEKGWQELQSGLIYKRSC